MSVTGSGVDPELEFLKGGGATGALLRAHDWSASPLGRPETWPQPLRTAVSLMLGAVQPVYIAWGAALTSLYNDGYLSIVGTKHPGIGLPFATLWAEIWEEFRPLIEKTLAGESQHFIDMPIALAGRPGRPLSYFTFSYTALRDVDGSVGGFYCAATETTDKVLSEAALRANEARFRSVLDGMAEGFGLLAPDFTILELNAEAMRLETRPREAIIGRTHWEAYPGSEQSPLGQIYKQAMTDRVPVALEHLYTWPDGREAWLDMRGYPTADGGLAIFYRDATEQRRAQELLRASEARQGFLLALADELRGLVNPMAVVASTTQALGQRLRASRVVFADIDEAQNLVATVGEWMDGTVPQVPGRLRITDFGDAIAGPLRRGETLRVADVYAHGASASSLAALDAIGVAAFVCVPLLKNGRFVATLNVHQSQARDWTDDEVEIIEVVAERTWETLERARSAVELRANEARHRATLEIETVAVVYFDMAGRITDANAAFLRLIGQSSAALHAHQLRDDNAPAPEWIWHDTETIQELLTAGRGGPSEKSRVKRDGSHVCLLCASQKLDEHTAVEFIIDITERKEAEAALRGAEERLRLAVDNAEIGFWDVDEVNNSLIWPPRTKAAFGISPDVPVTMQDFYDGLHPDDRAVTSDAYAAAADPTRRALYDVEYRTVGKEDGVVRWVAAKGRGVFDADGRCLRVAGTVIDITARKAAEAALRASEARFEAIANSVDQMVWTTLPDGFHDYYNDRWYEFTGVPKGSTNGEGWIGLFHVDDHDRAWAKWRHSLATGVPYHIEYRLRHRSGQYRWVIGRAQCVRNDLGQITRWYGTCTDIHDIVEAREVLARSRAELEHLVDERTAERDQMWETSRDLMLAIDCEGMFQRVNPAWTTCLGYRDDELLGHHVNEFVLPDDQAGTVNAFQQAAAGERSPIENRFRHKDGSARWISWMAAPAGEMIYATGRDITEARERQAELEATHEALRQSQKMEAVGQLTGGIAHDFNNMLAVVMGSLDLLGRRLDPADARAKRYVDAAINGGRRAAQLTQRLLAFSRQQPLRPETVDANKLVAGMSDLLRHSLGGMVQLETVLSGGLWRVYADPNQLENVILNLAVNARDAMPDGGKLTVETQNTHLDTNYVAEHLGVAAGQYVLIAVTDTGTGMTKEVIAKAFDPFFTTKEVGKGTGLGLSQVYGFVKQSNGHVKIYSEPGQGTTFKVYLPRHIGPADEPNIGNPAEELPLGELQEVLLVVEDEPWVRQFSVDALLELGYRVIEADGAASALRLLDAHPEIALMFTDIVMPGVNGAKLAEEARRRRPDLRVLFTTGYTRNAVVHNGVVDPGVELIGKPFTIEQLAARVREVLDSPP